MQTNSPTEIKNQTDVAQLVAKEYLRRLKLRLIQGYCHGRLTEAEVARAFENFPELRSA